MQLSRFQKITLGIGGVTALTIGSLILLVPHSFYASYGIALPRDPNMLSELRAPGAALATLGAIMLFGIVRASAAQISLVAALTVYLAFPVGRAVSLAVDGVPAGSILAALFIEIAVACLLLAAFRPVRTQNASRTRLVNPQI